MKFYEIPEMNISEFAMENVVTTSSVTKATEALEAAGYSSSEIVKTTVSDWTAIS